MEFFIGTANGWDFGVNDFGNGYIRVSDVDVVGATVPAGNTLNLGNVMGGVIVSDSKIYGDVAYTIQSDDPMDMWIGFENCDISEESVITVSYWGDDSENPTELMSMNLRQYIEECENVEGYGEFVSKKLADKMAVLTTI